MGQGELPAQEEAELPAEDACAMVLPAESAGEMGRCLPGCWPDPPRSPGPRTCVLEADSYFNDKEHR